jgi:hypothetical protein
MTKKIKVIKEKKSNIKLISATKSSTQNLESEIFEGESEQLAKLISRKRSSQGANTTIEQEEIVGDKIVRTTRTKEDDEEINFRPSYEGASNSYQSQTYSSSEYTPPGVQGEGAQQRSAVASQDQFLTRTESASQNSAISNDNDNRRKYVGNEKSNDDRKGI